MPDLFMIIGTVCLISVTLGPWVHAFQLSQITRRLTVLEDAVDGLYDDGDGDDPEKNDTAKTPENVIAISRRAA